MITDDNLRAFSIEQKVMRVDQSEKCIACFAFVTPQVVNAWLKNYFVGTNCLSIFDSVLNSPPIIDIVIWQGFCVSKTIVSKIDDNSVMLEQRQVWFCAG